ncbi:hypothetical protein LTR82_016255 [Friedmanniomyces endolithicus]|uniref:Uncharacterized protein n=1 Tax=Friedmanniomyces endolithicus TaxID=329885 RepID=A0AAN6FA77_9PEZI|nr:hypothetical protein LTR82_016255 [Friedmanniomyces endolithicus]
MDHLPPTYIEERLAADEAKRLAALQQEAIQQRAQQAKQQQITPRNLTQALLQRPPLSRPNSSGFLGGIYQGFMRAASASPSPLPSPGPTPCATPPPGQVKPVMSVEAEKLIAEQKRDADIGMSGVGYRLATKTDPLDAQGLSRRDFDIKSYLFLLLLFSVVLTAGLI